MRTTTLPPLWADLAKAYGGVASLARKCGVSPATIWRWGKGDTPNGSAGVAVGYLCLAKGLPNPLAATGAPD